MVGPDWPTRKVTITDEVEAALKPIRGTIVGKEPVPIRSLTDTLGWYLHLCDELTNEVPAPTFEMAQATRVIQVFTEIGRCREMLDLVDGIEVRVKRLVDDERNAPDGGLFEILVALAYVKSDWNVRFIPEEAHKTSDIHVVRREEEFFVECKRMRKSSEYSLNERDHFTRIWEPASRMMRMNGLHWVLDIVFHLELQRLTDDFLQVRLAGVGFIPPGGTQVSDEFATINIRETDLDPLRAALENGPIRIYSPLFVELTLGKFENTRSYKSLMSAKTQDTVWLEDVDFLLMAVWHCDDPECDKKKARHILRHLSKANKQLPHNKPGIIHFGIESNETETVELLRIAGIDNAIQSFDSEGKDLRWIFCNFYQPSMTSDASLHMDETVRYYSRNSGTPPIPGPTLS